MGAAIYLLFFQATGRPIVLNLCSADGSSASTAFSTGETLNLNSQ